MVLRRRGPGLRARLTLLSTGLVAAVSALLLWLGWLLVGRVVSAVPQLPPDTPVRVDGTEVSAAVLGEALRQAAQREVLQAGAVAFVLVVLAAAVLSWVVAGRVLRPLQEVTAAARRLSAESLDERIRLPGPRDEVAKLADTFDAMLDRLQASFGAQRRFVANASHELRTPLTVIRTEVDVTLADPAAPVAELRRMAEVVRAATHRADHLIAGLLLLARTEAAGVDVHEPVDLASAVPEALSAAGTGVAVRSLRIEVHAAPARTLGDPVLLERVVGNLVENAVQHNVPGGWIKVRTGACPSGVELRVASSGPPVPAERVAELFEPFRRGSDSGSERVGGGVGLGLSIVRAVVAAHGGRVSAEPVPAGGLTVTVHLPAL